MKNRYVLLLDFPLIAAAAVGAFILRFEWTFEVTRPEYRWFLIAALLVKPIVFGLFGLYNRYWKYASIFDLLLIGVGVSVSSLVLALAVGIGVFTGAIEQFSRAVLVNDWLLTFLAVAGMRLSVRLLAEATRRRNAGPTERRVLVAGAGEAGVLIVREMRKNLNLGLVPVGFIDDDAAKHGHRILGIPVAGPLSDMAKAVELFRADEIVIAMPKAPGRLIRQVAESARELRLRPRIMPGVYEMLQGHSDTAMRDVEISDLLRRDPVSSDSQSIQYLEGRVVLVTGAGGSIGSELSRQLAGAGVAHLILLGHGENSIFEIEREVRHAHPLLQVDAVIADVRDRARLDVIFARYSPSIVFHAAAHKHVPLMETNPIEAVTNNILGTRNVVLAADQAGVERLVCISTDKAVSPSSVMGASKRVAEMIVRGVARRTGRQYACVRFGNVLGSRGSVVGIFKDQIARGGPVMVTHPDMTRYFMTIPEAVHLVIEAGGLGQSGDLFVLNMGQPVRIMDLAHDLIALSGANPDSVRIEFSGLRPGEKLTESLFEAEAIVSTVTPDIMRVIEPVDFEPSLLDSFVNDFARLGENQDAQAVRLLRQAVPTFTPATMPAESAAGVRD